MSEEDALVGPVLPPELSVASFNVRRAPERSRGWLRRRARIRTLVGRERPSVLGVQEALPGQARFLQDALGPEYRCVGIGRERSGNGEGCPVLFDTSRLELQGWEQTALSPTPAVPGSRGWGAAFPRVVVRLRLRDRVTGTAFTAVNTHLDVLSGWARARSAERIEDAAGIGAAVVTGDFNEGPDAPARRALAAVGLIDTWDGAAERLTRERGTFAPHRRRAARRPRIDAVLARGWDVTRVAIDARPIDGGWASDHALVTAVLR